MTMDGGITLRIGTPILLALLTPASALGGELQGTAVFAVAKDPSGQKAAAIADALLRSKVIKTPGLRLIEPARALSGDPRTREEETLERARTALADGRRAYDALKLDDAIARLGQAVNLYQQTGPLLGDLQELETTLAYLGAALTLRGSADEGQSTFVELLTINQSYQLERFPPAVQKTFEAASQKVERAPTGAVEVYSTPPYAAVYLDGRFEGVTPLVLTDVIGGNHYLRIEKLGYVVHGAPLEVSANQRITSQTRLRSLKRGVELRDVTARCAEELGQEGMGGSLRTLARMLVADTVLFVSVTQSGTEASFVGAVFDASTGTRLATERAVASTTSPNFANELGAFADRLIGDAQHWASSREAGATTQGGAFGLDPGGGGGKDAAGDASLVGKDGLSSPPPGNIGLEGKAPAPTPMTQEQYLGWGLVIVGGVAVVTGIVFAGLATKAHSDYRATSQASPDLRHIGDVGKTDSLIADLSMGGGILAAAGGVAVLLVSRPREPSVEELLRSPHASVQPIPHGAVAVFGVDLP